MNIAPNISFDIIEVFDNISWTLLKGLILTLNIEAYFKILLPFINNRKIHHDPYKL